MKVRDLIGRLAAFDADQEVRIALQCTTLNELSNPIDHDNFRCYPIDTIDVGPLLRSDPPLRGEPLRGDAYAVALYATDTYYTPHISDDPIDAEQFHDQNPHWHRSVIVETAPQRLAAEERARILMDALEAVRSRKA